MGRFHERVRIFRTGESCTSADISFQITLGKERGMYNGFSSVQNNLTGGVDFALVGPLPFLEVQIYSSHGKCSYI
jgi:hypothetical protein